MADRGLVTEILRQKLTGRDRRSEARPSVKRTSISLPEDLYRRLKVLAAVEGRKMNDLMVELLREAMERRLAEKEPFEGW